MFAIPKAALLPLWAMAGLQLVPAPALAQTRPAAPASSSPSTAAPLRPDPTDAGSSVPSALYASPLRAYQRFAEPPVAPWRDTNEVVRQRGGWRAYAREAGEPEAAQPAASGASQPAPAKLPAARGHAGHGTK